VPRIGRKVINRQANVLDQPFQR